jgi:hypothetical protein
MCVCVCKYISYAKCYGNIATGSRVSSTPKNVDEWPCARKEIETLVAVKQSMQHVVYVLLTIGCPCLLLFTHDDGGYAMVIYSAVNDTTHYHIMPCQDVLMTYMLWLLLRASNMKGGPKNQRKIRSHGYVLCNP